MRSTEQVINADAHQGLRDKLAKVRTSFPDIYFIEIMFLRLFIVEFVLQHPW